MPKNYPRIALIIFFSLTFLHHDLSAQLFPQDKINKALMEGTYQERQTPEPPSRSAAGKINGVFNFLKTMPIEIQAMQSKVSGENLVSSTDTVIVGLIPNDTLFITGTWFNNGPIIVLSDGVLIMDHANATLLGNIYVFQDGKMFADSSTINCPQQYFYQRSIIIANNGFVSISNTTLDYGGLSHNLAVTDNGVIEMSNITNIGFTTAGAYVNGSISIDGTNQAGEFIMTDSASLNFANANTLLLWHHVDDSGTVDVTFPSGANVAAYQFDESQPGVDGIGYNVTVANCTDVMWALMPEGGSDITITGSSLRAIGLWFTGNDTVSVSGLVNNSSYTSFTAPLSDRVLQLNTTSVQTWSLYIFNQTQVDIMGCIVGEVGSMGTSLVTAQGILCDGSGGYYWSSDTSLSIVISSTVLGYIRSQGNGIVLLGYGSSTAGASAIDNSIMVVTQSSLPQDPVAYDHGTAWRVHIDPPQNLFVDTVINITGSAWVDQGPLGSFMDFGFYTVEYKQVNASAWTLLAAANSNEVHNNLLAQWNTQGLTPGAYQLRLNTQNNLGDSIDAVVQVTLLPSILGSNELMNTRGNLIEACYETKSNQIKVSVHVPQSTLAVAHLIKPDGREIFSQPVRLIKGENQFLIPANSIASGNYFIRILSGESSITGKLIVVK